MTRPLALGSLLVLLVLGLAWVLANSEGSPGGAVPDRVPGPVPPPEGGATGADLASPRTIADGERDGTSDDGPGLAEGATAVNADPGRASLRLRVLAPGSVPLASADVAVEVVERVGRSGIHEFDERRTDAAGHLEVEVNSGPVGSGGRTLTLTWRADPTDDEGPSAHARVDLARDFTPGAHDLGDVHLAWATEAPPVPRLVHGRVLLADGTAAERPGLRVEERGPGAADWRPVSVRREDTGEAGGFELFGLPARPDARLRLVGSDRGHLPTALPFEPGQRVDLRLDAAGTIVGAVVVDEALRDPVLRRRRLLVGAWPQGPDGAADGAATEPRDPDVGDASPGLEVRVERDGTFRLGGLVPGPHRVSVRSADAPEPSLWVEDVEAVAGDAPRDPRLDPLDLTGRLDLRTVRLVDAEGEPGPSGEYAVAPRGTEPGQLEGPRRDLRTREFSDGELPLVAIDGEALDVALWPEGYGRVVLLDLVGDRTVTLPARHALVLRLTADSPLPAPPHELAPSLVLDGGWFHPVEGRNTALGPERALRFEDLPEGEYRLVWMLFVRRGGAASGHAVELGHPTSVTVGPDEGVQEVEVRVGAAELEALLRNER